MLGTPRGIFDEQPMLLVRYLLRLLPPLLWGLPKMNTWQKPRYRQHTVPLRWNNVELIFEVNTWGGVVVAVGCSAHATTAAGTWGCCCCFWCQHESSKVRCHRISASRCTSDWVVTEVVALEGALSFWICDMIWSASDMLCGWSVVALLQFSTEATCPGDLQYRILPLAITYPSKWVATRLPSLLCL